MCRSWSYSYLLRLPRGISMTTSMESGTDRILPGIIIRGRWRPAVPSIHGVPPHQRDAPLRLHHHRRAEDRGAAGRGGRDRPRVRQPRHPLAGDRGREAGRGGPQHPQPPLLGEPGHPEAAGGRGRPVPAPLRRRSRPRHRDHLHHRRQGGLQPPHVGAARTRRRLHRAVPVVPDPHLGAAVRGSRGARGPDDHRRQRRRAVPRADPVRLRALVASSQGHRLLVPAQPHHRLRRPRVLPGPRRLRP